MFIDSTNGIKEFTASVTNEQSNRVETNTRGVRYYAQVLGFTTHELISKISGQDVIDLGAAKGRFAIELEYAGICRSIKSLNANYKHEGYEKIWQDDDFLVDISIDNESALELRANDSMLVHATQAASRNRLALDWDLIADMRQIPTESADKLISSHGFPYYSDFGKAIYDLANLSKYNSPATFGELRRILRPKGQMYLHTALSVTNWDRASSVNFEKELINNALKSFNLKLLNIQRSKVINSNSIVLIISK